MAALSWRGSTDGDFSDANNWVVTSTGSTPGSPPANSDTLTFDYGLRDVDDGLTTGLTGITLVKTPGYTGRIAPGDHLSIATASVRADGVGVLNLSGNMTAGNIRMPGGSFSYGGGTATNLFIERMDASIAAAAVVTNIRCFRAQISDLNNGTGYTTAKIVDSVFRSKRAGKFLLKGSSTLEAGVACALSDESEVDVGSKLFYKSAETIAGSVEVHPHAIFDVSGNPGFTWGGSLIRWSDSVINLDAANGTVTPSTVVQYGLSQQSSGPVPA